MDARFFAAGCVAVLVACQTDEPPAPEPVEFAEVCGSAEPVRLLQFEPWRAVEWAHHRGVVGERRLLILNYSDTAASGLVLMSVGMCGEQPRQLASGVSSIWESSRYDAPLLCNNDTGEVRIVDPTGERPSQLVFSVSPQNCFTPRTEAGVFHIQPASAGSPTGSLILQRWPDDPWAGPAEPELVLTGVKTWNANPLLPWSDASAGDDDEVFVVTDTDELVRVTTELEVEVIATQVRSFDRGSERVDGGTAIRYLLWQSAELSNHDPELPEGELFLLDRETGEQTSVGHGAIWAVTPSPLAWATDGLMQLREGDGADAVLRLYSLPSLEYVEVPGTLEPRSMLGERALFVHIDDGLEAILDIRTGEMQVLEGQPATRWSVEGWLSLLPSARGGQVFADSELWLLRDGGPAELVAKRATVHHQFMPDGRVITGIGLDVVGNGDLIVVDPATFEERLIASDIDTSSIAGIGDTDLTYSVLEGERRGVWLARLPPRE